MFERRRPQCFIGIFAKISDAAIAAGASVILFILVVGRMTCRTDNLNVK